jgi:Arc/MetJ-type ribon-helix-helix transcriptional regulator
MSDVLNRNRDLILQEERSFARAVAVCAVEKPKTSFWLVVIPILFLYYAYLIKKYKKSLARFVDDFLITRNRAMDLAWDVVTAGGKPAIEKSAWMTTLHGDLQRPYSLWLVALTDYYSFLLPGEGASFAELVRGRYGNRSEYLHALNRLNSAEREFYAALKPQMKAMDGAVEIITVVEKTSRSLRREMAERIFS